MSGDPERFKTVTIVNLVDGGTVEGHDAVQAHFDKEQKLLEEHGSTITFQVYRPNLAATTPAELQGERVAELKVGAGFVAGEDSVAAVKRKVGDALRPSRPDLNLADVARVTFFFDGRRMQDEKLFFAGHFMMVPAWVQVVLHDCEVEELVAIIERVRATKANPRCRGSPARRGRRPCLTGGRPILDAHKKNNPGNRETGLVSEGDGGPSDEEEHRCGRCRFGVAARGDEHGGHTSGTTARVGVNRVVASHREE